MVVGFAPESQAQYDSTWHSSKDTVRHLYDIAWLEAGVGSIGGELGYQLGLNIQLKDRFMIAAGFDQALYMGTDVSDLSLYSLSMDMGYVLRGYKVNLLMTTGASYSRGRQQFPDAPGSTELFDIWGVKFKAGAFASRFPVGVSGFVHFNTRNTYSGVTLNLVLKRKRR